MHSLHNTSGMSEVTPPAVTPPAEVKTDAGLLTGIVPDAKAAADALAAKATADAAAAAALDPVKAAADAAKAKTDADKIAAEAKANSIPEKYEFTKPATDALNADDEADTIADAKAMGLTAKQAQALYDHRAAQIKTDTQAYKDQITRVQKGWVEELRNDKEFGPKFEANLLAANKAISRFSPDGQLAKLLAIEGMANNPTIAKFLASIGNAMSEGTFIVADPTITTAPKAGERTFEQTANGLFPSLVKNNKG
jgi:hypothetical protein